jgi:CRP/FNR family transcriptional regulator
MTEKELAKHFPTFEQELLAEIVKVGELKEIHEGETIIRTGQNIRAEPVAFLPRLLLMLPF